MIERKGRRKGRRCRKRMTPRGNRARRKRGQSEEKEMEKEE